jgi:DNA repair protein RadC
MITLYTGSLNSSTVRIGELFKEAIRMNAASIILIHNHPSGDPSPSPEDINLTRAAVQAGKLLDIEVLDHIIIGFGPGKYSSLKKKELGF